MESAEKTRNYRSFSSAAKSRFRPMAELLGYEQITATAWMAPGLFVVALSSQNGVIVILQSNGD
ncbi:hypothetical protein [Marinobacter profundi]|uniref:hypothetical protein n=1 Tax=Marinobacter profundi TaxID=2666256 RepID=UPI00117E1728|nr:hypothetical protein [Marinobacter profundi]